MKKQLLMIAAVTSIFFSQVNAQQFAGPNDQYSTISRQGLIQISGSYGDKLIVGGGGQGGGGTTYFNEQGLRMSVFNRTLKIGAFPGVTGFNGVGIVGEDDNFVDKSDVGVFGGTGSGLYLGGNKQIHLTVLPSGIVGIGTLTPAATVMFHLKGNTATNSIMRIEPLNWNTGTVGSTAKIELGDQNNYLNMVLGTGMRLNTSSDLIFSTNNAERMKIDASGKVSLNGIMAVGSNTVPSTYQFAVVGKSNFNGIVSIGDLNSGFTTPKMYPIASGYSLYVVGGIMSEQVKVALKSTANWSDYVFENDYKLSSLKEIKKYVQENKHLPNFPSANELVKSGINLAEMDAKLLEKIEELTLHLIALDDKNDKLEKELEVLKKKCVKIR